jgi:hypothetical protein
MHERITPLPTSLYEQDETAWLEQTAKLVEQRRFGEIDHEHLQEYLSDMARRDKREVFSRLRTVIVHLLKVKVQPERRSKSWQRTILEQRSDLEQLLQSATLRRHAGEVLGQAYKKAVNVAAVETGLAEEVFPSECFLSLEEVLGSGS